MTDQRLPPYERISILSGRITALTKRVSDKPYGREFVNIWHALKAAKETLKVAREELQ